MTQVSEEMGLKKRISTESLRKSFLRNIFEAADNKLESLEYIEFFTGDRRRPTPAYLLKYIGVLDREKSLILPLIWRANIF